jgi:hypothetical protein
MQIYIALNTNFLTSEPSAREWIHEYCQFLKEMGVQCVLFDGKTAKIPDQAIVHFFSSFDAETWKVLAETGRKVVVTPTLNSRVKFAFMDWIRSKFFKKKNSLTEVQFRKYGCHFLVTSETAKEQVERYWGIGSVKVSIFGHETKKAAKVASALYNQLSSL